MKVVRTCALNIVVVNIELCVRVCASSCAECEGNVRRIEGVIEDVRTERSVVIQ